MPCSCSSCLSGIKDGPAQKVAICDLNLVECGAQIPGLGDVTGQIDASPAAIVSADAQDITDMGAFFVLDGTSFDAVAAFPTGISNALVDDGNTWDIGDAAHGGEAIFRVEFDNPFAVCLTSEITFVSLFIDYESVVTSGVGVAYPGIWVAWRLANGTLIKMADLAGASNNNVQFRGEIPGDGLVTVDDIVNGHAVIGCNIYALPNRSQSQINYIAARFDYDATSCYDPSTATGGTRVMPVSIVCDTSSNTATRPPSTLAWDMQSNTAIVPNGGSVVVETNPNMHVMSVYNPGANQITVDFFDSDGNTKQQIIPPSSNYTFGVDDDYLAFGTSFTFSNAGASNITIIWNTSTTGG